MVKKVKKTDRTIGYVTLTIGVGALLLVGVLAMKRYGIGPAAIQGMGIAKTVEGDWESDFSGYHAIFQTHNGTFQILATRKGEPHYFSRGRVEWDGNKLILTPDDSLGEPKSDSAAITYTKMTYGTYTVIVARNGDAITWRSGPVDPERASVNPEHPLIQYSGQDVIIWSPKK